MSSLTAPATTTGLIASTLTLSRRSLLRFFRTPQEVVAGTASTAMFMLIFLYVFGGEISIPGLSYVDFLVPGYLAGAALFVGMGTATAVAEDLEQGVVDRLRSLPMPRVAFLTGRALADTAVLLWSVLVAGGIGFAVGFRFHGSVVDVLLATGLLVLAGFAFIWLFIVLGLFAGTAKGAQGLAFLVFPLTFVSSAYVRVEALPGWMQAFAKHQPVTPLVNAVRGLMSGPGAAALLAEPTSAHVTRSLLWVAAIMVIAVPTAVARFQRG